MSWIFQQPRGVCPTDCVGWYCSSDWLCREPPNAVQATKTSHSWSRLPATARIAPAINRPRCTNKYYLSIMYRIALKENYFVKEMRNKIVPQTWKQFHSSQMFHTRKVPVTHQNSHRNPTLRLFQQPISKTFPTFNLDYSIDLLWLFQMACIMAPATLHICFGIPLKQLK